MLSFEINPIGTVRNDRTDVQHTDNWGAVRSTITIDERFGEACLQGMEGFSHVEVLFIFDHFPEHDDYREPRPNRGVESTASVSGWVGSWLSPGCDWSEESTVGVGSTALDAIVASVCPPGLAFFMSAASWR